MKKSIDRLPTLIERMNISGLVIQHLLCRSYCRLSRRERRRSIVTQSELKLLFEFSILDAVLSGILVPGYIRFRPHEPSEPNFRAVD